MTHLLNNFPVMWMPGTTEWVVILIIVLVLFGRKIPGLGRSLGSGIREFKEGLSGEDTESSNKPSQAHPDHAAMNTDQTGDSTNDDADTHPPAGNV